MEVFHFDLQTEADKESIGEIMKMMRMPILRMVVLTSSDEDDDSTDPVDGVHDSLLAALAV